MMRVYTILFLVLLAIPMQAQSKKKIREKEIISKTIVDINYDDGKGEEVIREIIKFDSKGNVIEEIDYDNNKVDRKIIYTYNDDNDVIKESHYESNGTLKKVIEYTYNDGLKVEKTLMDGKGRIIEKRKYIYEYDE